MVMSLMAKDKTGLDIRLKRAYDDPADGDGCRILVDRIWPRGVSKDDLALDHWLKDLAPSTGLRKWFGHDPQKWDGFKERYFKELDGCSDAIDQLLEWGREGRITLIYGAKDTEHNNAVALKAYLEKKLAGKL